MVEINNQRKAFLDMLAWSEGTDNGRQKTRNHGYDVIVGGELFTDYSDHPRKLVTLNPKLKSAGAGRYQLLSRWWDAYRKQLGLKDFSPKSQDAVALRRLRSVALYLWLIVVISVRQSTVAAISGLHCRAPGYGQFEHESWQPDCKIQRSGRNGQRDWCMSRVTAIISLWLSASSSACHGLLIITAITPLPTKPSATKCQRTEAGERSLMPLCRCVSVMLLSMQNTWRS